jgi:hypothetical protein
MIERKFKKGSTKKKEDISKRKNILKLLVWAKNLGLFSNLDLFGLVPSFSASSCRG